MEVVELYDLLGKDEISGQGISPIAAKDGTECIAEVEVLLKRGDKIPDEAMKLYKRYMRG